MRRFLIIDDDVELPFLDELRSENGVDGVDPDVTHINPNDFIKDGGGQALPRNSCRFGETVT